MNNTDISHKPNLIVRWMDPKDSGMTLQVYAFLIDSNLATYEWKQSQIMEHIITSMEWFGLRLYQSPSAYDVSNSNIHIDNPVLYKEVK
jgi:miniconductance mechanosensitive channel